MARRNLRYVTMVGALAIALASCGGGSSNKGSGTTPSTGKPSLPPCPLAALRDAKKPVEITYWHALTRANED